jgi:hypothetical protein
MSTSKVNDRKITILARIKPSIWPLSILFVSNSNLDIKLKKYCKNKVKKEKFYEIL